MTLSETKQQILHSDAFVMAEYLKLREAYNLKQVIRYDHERQETITTESVAEHVFGMHVLQSYFLPLEDEKQAWDKEKIWLMSTYHDIDEVETGDTIGYLKPDTDVNIELQPALRVVQTLPASLAHTIAPILEEYAARNSIESKFVKALDKLESLFHLYGENGKAIQHQCNTTFSQHDSIKTKYIIAFPYMQRFNEVLSEHMKKEGYFVD